MRRGSWERWAVDDGGRTMTGERWVVDDGWKTMTICVGGEIVWREYWRENIYNICDGSLWCMYLVRSGLRQSMHVAHTDSIPTP